METISAKLEYIIFQNKDTHYVVGSFSDLNEHYLFTAAGKMADPKEDQEYELMGQYIRHPKYGEQFQIQSSQIILPSHKDAIVHFLSSDTFPTIGKATAQKIYELLGDTCLEQIKEDYSILYQIPKLPQKKIDIIRDGIEQFTGFNEAHMRLIEYGLDESKIELLEKAYKEKLMEILEKDCFLPYYEIYGFGYKSACKLADGFQIDAYDTRRLDAYVYENARQLAMATGNTYVMTTSLLQACKLNDITLLHESLNRLSVQESLHIENNRVYPFSLYEDEICIAKKLHIHSFDVTEIDDETLESKIKEVEFSYAIEYDEVQKQAIRLFFQKSFFILNGGPGTGKTTTVKGILKICQIFFPDANIQLCAPTGRASKRLAQLSNYDSRTIHSLLQWDMESNSFGKNEEELLDVDFLIVDEFSMVDTHLFASLLKALPDTCRILLIGDEDQLESVGPGKVFEDIIESHICPIVHLEKIFRQSHGSGIVRLAGEIREEKECHYEDGVIFEEMDTNSIISKIREYTMGNDLDNLQILAPMYKGVAGIHAINEIMQLTYNPKGSDKQELKVGNTIFRENDKVMLLKNLPDDDVYNGDIGTILEIAKPDKNTNVISVDFGNTIVDFSRDFLYYLTHAYCISVHKAQGSEYDTVICVVDPSARYMLEKRLLYTGISRAKKQLILLGNRQLFETQVRLKQRRLRQTSLQERIKQYEEV